MNLSSSVRIWARTVLRIVRSITVLTLWYMPVGVALFHAPARVTVAVAILTAMCAVYWYALRKPRATEHFGALPLQPLGPSARWVAGLAFVTPLVVGGAGTLFTLLGYPLDHAPDPVDPFLHRAGGRLAFSAVAVLVAPVLEEFAFRGWIQSTLERQLGALWAIAVAALLFAVVHGEPLWTPFLFLDAAVMGVAVYLTRSIWAGVAIHAGNNLLAVLSDMPRVAAWLDELGRPRWWTLLPYLLLTGLAFVYLLRGLLRATRGSTVLPSLAQPQIDLVQSSAPP